MTASTPATPDPRTETIMRQIQGGVGLMSDDRIREALAALASLAAELAATRQALEQAVILEYDPSKTDEQNAELHRRAVAVRAVLAGEDTT